MNTFTNISRERWANEAQLMELRCWINTEEDGDDHNKWWCEKFDNYKSVTDRNFKDVLEIGCGPWAKNIQIFTRLLKNKPTMYVNDPLLSSYIELKKSVANFMKTQKVLGYTKPLEELECDPVDCVICINVLDHVFSVKKCFEKFKELLRPGGVLILGQDLKDDSDRNNDVVKNDKMHPIMLDDKEVDNFLGEDYKVLYKKVLTREESRYPKYNSGTYFFIGEK